jgi:hypothetical protein
MGGSSFLPKARENLEDGLIFDDLKPDTATQMNAASTNNITRTPYDAISFGPLSKSLQNYVSNTAQLQ